jgi:hypothetical protein
VWESDGNRLMRMVGVILIRQRAAIGAGRQWGGIDDVQQAGGSCRMCLMVGDDERRQWNSVDKAWEGNGTGLMIPDGWEDGGNVFDGREQ